MSGHFAVRRLLLCGCLGLALPSLVLGAVFVSLEEAADTQPANGTPKTLQKRSTDNNVVEVYSVTIDCTVTSRFAHTVITSKALNKANSSQEIFFEVELPKTAFITNFTMEIEGRVYVGVVKEKEKAKKQYETAVKAGQTAALVKASGRNMEKFAVSVNIAALSNVTFTLTHEELLQRKLGQYEILTRVKPKQRIQEFKIVTNIYEPQGISYVDVHSTFLSNELLPLVEKTVTDKKAHISFSPTLEQQRSCPYCEGSVIDGDFIVKYDVKREKGLGDIQVINGYFVHYFGPPDLRRVPMNVVFVIDESGSMAGPKIRQTREAMVAIIQDLHEEDHFGIVTFDDYVRVWKPTLQQATNQTIKDAMEFAKKITNRGMTDINAGVLKGVEMLRTARRDEILPQRSSDMIILLTDGMPNSGVSDPVEIHKNVREAIGGNMSLNCLGFGNDVEYPFLDVMSQQNKGFARRIFTDSDASLQLQGFYEEVSSPLLLEVDLKYPSNTVDFLTTNHFNQLFNGSEIIVAGRLMDNDIDNFLVEVFGVGYEDYQVQGQASVSDWGVMYPDEEYVFGDFTERLWAYLTIQQLLDKSKVGSPQEKDSITAKALDMSLLYNFVTPLTSMVVTKPETDDTLQVADKLTEEQRQNAERMGFTSEKKQSNLHLFQSLTLSTSNCFLSLFFIYLRSETSFLSAPKPTYLFGGWRPSLSDRASRPEDALCFNINAKPGTIFTLVKDQMSGVLVNGQIIGDKAVPPDGHISTYFGRFGIVHQTLGVNLEVSTQDISVFQNGNWVKLLWSGTASLKGPNMDLLLTKDRSLTVTLKDSVKFVILLHKVWKKHPYHRDYLGFYTLDSHLLSPNVHGLLGQFYHSIEFEVSNLRPGQSPEKPDATMFVKGHELNVTRGWQRDFRRAIKKGESIPCWFIHNNATGLIDGEATDYVVTGLFSTL
uniref:Inter-alpha-trypsin inhibitor heavy chain H3 n=1 Tax=Neogobius melanostomus TaxID=47308 RepID=A0A8C6V5M8_9GOBI